MNDFVSKEAIITALEAKYEEVNNDEVMKDNAIIHCSLVEMSHFVADLIGHDNDDYNKRIAKILVTSMLSSMKNAMRNEL